ncbi:hypothetical protein MPSEU_000750500 [Mayamaea pseudoterrestris]|nr:hypothetical protein MPSEU_000750500 [Mayamaea pseudoterrestris]
MPFTVDALSSSPPFSYRPNAVEEAYALYLLRTILRRDYDCQSALQLSAKQASVLFSLTGVDKVLLKYIWMLVTEKKDEKDEATAELVGLTSLDLFHVCLRFISLAQNGQLLAALAKAFREQQASKSIPAADTETSRLKSTPLQVMEDCFVSSVDDLIALPQFAGVEVPKLKDLRLIYNEHLARSTRSKNGDADDKTFQAYARVKSAASLKQVDESFTNNDWDQKTMHTSNVSSKSRQQPTVYQDESIATELIHDEVGGDDEYDEFASVYHDAPMAVEQRPVIGLINAMKQSNDNIATDSSSVCILPAKSAQNDPTMSNFAVTMQNRLRFVAGVALLHTWTSYHRAISLAIPLYATALLVTNVLDLLNWQSRNVNCKLNGILDGLYLVAILFSLLTSSSSGKYLSWTGQLSWVSAHHCVRLVALGLWWPRAASWCLVKVLELSRLRKDKEKRK